MFKVNKKYVHNLLGKEALRTPLAFTINIKYNVRVNNKI